MAKNAFSKFQGYVDKPKRNVFDLSFQNNLTAKFGYLTPVFCKEVIPGDSFRIDPRFGFRLMPLVFPIQTRITANLHFFYVRNRNLWKDWPDFIGKTKEGLIPPYLAPLNDDAINSMYKTGSLGDYLGLPTTIVGAYGYSEQGVGVRPASGNGFFVVNDINGNVVGYEDLTTGVSSLDKCPFDDSMIRTQIATKNQTWTPVNWLGFQLTSIDGDLDLRNIEELWYNTATAGASAGVVYLVCNFTYQGKNYSFAESGVSTRDTQSMSGYNTKWQIDNITEFRSRIQKLIDNGVTVSNFYLMKFNESASSSGNDLVKAWSDGTTDINDHNHILYSGRTSDVQDITTMTKVPYYVAQEHQEYKTRISALPFRAYESIYNAFYRNQQNDPFMINGVTEYNKFIPNDEGGADNTVYELHKRNWEKDYLTTSVQTPQQGVAPLVGVSSTGTFTFENAEGTQYTAKAVVGEDGHTLTGIETMSPELNANGTGRMLVDMISHGISINDFRNVNALQRWLETNIRRGLRYKDQIMSHFGVDPDYAAMDMPEFIGGMSRPVEISVVTQTSEGDDPLGSYAANGGVYGEGSSITKYCDEHGFIIGILSFVPTPNYSQLLPKLFLKSDPLDYFFPEFGHIGMQPILYNEVCPVQAYYDQTGDSPSDPDILHKEFGYQRAWYDYLGSVDEVHGLMRTDLRNFVMNRTFDTLPQLGKKFLEVDPLQLNEVFADTTADADKILGVVDFRVTAKRPIPMFGIPRLE